MDKDSEYLPFLTIFCGKRRSENNETKVPVSYSTVAKWELYVRIEMLQCQFQMYFINLKNCKSIKFKIVLAFLSEP